MRFDYLIVGAGLFGSVFAQRCKDNGKTVLVIDKRDHIGGNCYTFNHNGIDVHAYGPHIFHTNSQKIWEYINQFSSFNNFIYSPVANYQDKLYSLPFNMWTFYQLWGVTNPAEAQQIIESQRYTGSIHNLEDQALSMVGVEVYEKLIKGYTIKQWNKDPKELPSFIIKRLPVRYTFDNNYFNDKYQGIPSEGYTKIFENLLDGIHVELGVDYFSRREYYNSLAKNIVYTGPIDKYYNNCYGQLDYRSLRFEHESRPVDSVHGSAVINYTDFNTPYTRSIEHKHFNNSSSAKNVTMISKEYPAEYKGNSEPYYPINTERNQSIVDMYQQLNKNQKNVIFGGRLAEYRYYDMHQVIGSALQMWNSMHFSS